MSQHKYEIMVIVEPDVDDRTVGSLLDKFLAVVPKEGGTVEKVDVWGRRKFAYPIKKFTEGSYAVVNVEAESSTVDELDRLLNLSESVLRTKVLRAEEAVVDMRKKRHHGSKAPAKAEA